MITGASRYQAVRHHVYYVGTRVHLVRQVLFTKVLFTTCILNFCVSAVCTCSTRAREPYIMCMIPGLLFFLGRLREISRMFPA